LVVALLAAALVVPASGAGAVGYDPAADANSMASTAEYSGAEAWWGAGYTGKGIDVAVIDSGVAPVAGLNAPGKVIYGPDLSLESQARNLTNLDTFGHGTFMAGLIAGRDDALTAPYAGASASAYRGIAPDARILSLKVATADGGTDVSQVIAAIDWVVQHAHDPGLNVRVISLSYGTNSTQAYGADPLAYAVEQAWKRGIVVVAAAGNTGYQRGNNAPGLADPAYDPFVIAVGASDSRGTVATNDDAVASFSASSAGCGSCKNPDLVAPGAHLQGLRVANSWIDARHPEGLIDSRYFRGSGSSQAAAVMSGAVALVLQKHPTMSPDLVKRFFQSNAVKLASFDTQAQGAGEIRLGKMVNATPQWSYTGQQGTAASGTGSLELARGQDHLTRDGVALRGEQDVFGHAFDSRSHAAATAAGSSWSGGFWNGSSWSGSSWSGSSWSGSSWSGSSWSGSSWSGSSWSGSSWSGSSWSGSSWSGSSWSGSSWSSETWASAAWN
jgi:serine protease AprX